MMVKPKPSFFKVMIGDFTSSLKIPPSFNRHLRGRLGAKSVITSSGGRRWRVTVGRTATRWSFESGWKSFVEHHSVALGDFLVFFYDGDFRFDVKIYGKSGCEKEDELNFGSLASEPEKRSFIIGRTSGGLLIEGIRPVRNAKEESAFKAACSFKPSNPYFVAACRKARRHYMTIPQALAREYDLGGKMSINLQDPKGTSWHVKVGCRSGRVNLMTGWLAFSEGNCLKEGDVCVFQFCPGGDVIKVHIFRVEEKITESSRESGESIQSDTRPLIRADIERVVNTSTSLKTEYLSFVYSCKAYRIVTIPRFLVRKLALRMKDQLTLRDPCGRSWPVKIRKRANGNTDIGRGWCTFSKGNDLSTGDTCIFEFVEANVAQVHILRVETKTAACSD